MKRLVRFLLGIALFLIVLGVGALLFMDSLVRKAIEAGGSDALGVETRLESASIGLLSGTFTLAGLDVANPPGFAEQHFFALRSARLELPLAQLRRERIEIPSLELSGLTLDLERNQRGTNYGAILTSLERFRSDAPAGDGAEQPSGGKVFSLGELLLRDIHATVQLLPAAGDLTRLELAIPEVRVRGLASDLTLAQLCALVVRTTVDAAVRQGGDTLPRELLEDLRGALEASVHAKLDEKAGELHREATDRLLEGAGKLGPEAEAAARQASEALGSLLEKKN